MEKFPNYNEEEQLVEETVGNRAQKKGTSPSSSMSRFIKKNLGLAATVGLGYLGGLQEGIGDDTNSFHASKSEYSNAEEYVIQKVGATEDGKNNIYIIKDTKNGQEKRFFAESDKEAANVGPEYVKPLLPHEIAAVKNEQEFQRSGLVALEKSGSSTNSANTIKTHTEDRHFKGYGVDVKTQVEVDENGNIVPDTVRLTDPK